MRGTYHEYDGDLRLKMARSIDDIGLAATSRKFSCELGHDVSKNTLKSIQKSYHKQVRETGDPTKITTLPKGAQGRPTMLPSRIDGQVLRSVQALRENGAVVNWRITLAAAVGIVRTIQPSLLAEHRGSLTLSDSWAESFPRRENYIKRKATKAAKKLPEDFEIVRKEFHDRFAQVV